MSENKDPLTAYRLGQLEARMEQLDDLIQELLLELRSTKKAGKWVLGIAVAFGSFVTWLVDTLGFHIGGKS